LIPEFGLYPRAPGLAGLSSDTVLLVVEVADSSLHYDMGGKADLYASFGVRELWVIDAVRFATRVFRAPSEAGYVDTRDFTASETVVPRFAPAEFALALADLELE
jgi:Uma2 family endonuclease